MMLQRMIQSGELARHRESKTFVPIRVGPEPADAVPAYSQSPMAHVSGEHDLPEMAETAETDAKTKGGRP